jgi:hypothetical protein
LIEEQKIVKKVIKAQAKSVKPVKAAKATKKASK